MRSFCQIPLAVLSGLRRAGEALTSLLYPPHCANCQADTLAGSHLCAECAAGAPRVREPFCQQCSQPFSGAITSEFVCSNCAGRDFHFLCAVSRYRGKGVVKEFIHRFKYNRHFYLRHQLADWMAEALDDPRLQAPPIDFIVPVPLHKARLREREFNQAEVLARLLGRRAGLPVKVCLRRNRYTTTQTRLDRQARMENLRGAFCVRHTPTVTDRHLLLIDDVLTTGSTVEECARILLEAGAASVRVLTAARA
jgi:competence protein ComFC